MIRFGSGTLCDVLAAAGWSSEFKNSLSVPAAPVYVHHISWGGILVLTVYMGPVLEKYSKTLIYQPESQSETETYEWDQPFKKSFQ